MAGCAPGPEPPLRVATNVWPGYETLYLARSLGLYDQAAIRLVEMTSASEVSHALRNGTVEAAALTLDETLSLMQDGVDLRVVLVMDVSNGADVLLARAGIKDLPSLRGERVGVEDGATGAVMLDAALQAGQLSARDVRLVSLTVNQHAAAWWAGRVDALVTFEPVSSDLLAKDAHVLFDSSQIPGRILDVLVVRADFLESHQAQIKTLLAGHFAAQAYLARQPQDAAVRMAPRLAVAPGQVLAQMKGMKLPDVGENLQWLAGEKPKLMASANALANMMLQRQLLQHPVDVSRLAEAAFLPGRHP